MTPRFVCERDGVCADDVVYEEKVTAKLCGFGEELDETNMQTSEQMNAQSQTREYGEM